MKTRGIRFGAWLLIIGSILGLLICAGGLAGVWALAPAVRLRLTAGIDLVDRTLTTTGDGLLVLADTLQTSEKMIQTLDDSTATFSTSLEDTIPLVKQTGSMVGVDMVNVIQDTQTSLEAAQASARLMDDTIRVIAAIPFIGQRYEPTQSLSDGLSGIDASLDPLPDSRLRSRRTWTRRRITWVTSRTRSTNSAQTWRMPKPQSRTPRRSSPVTRRRSATCKPVSTTCVATWTRCYSGRRSASA